MHHTQQIMNTETLEPQLRPQDESEITPFPCPCRRCGADKGPFYGLGHITPPGFWTAPTPWPRLRQGTVSAH